jgi:hypothetical protein
MMRSIALLIFALGWAVSALAFTNDDAALSNEISIPYYDDQTAFESILAPVDRGDAGWSDFLARNGAWTASVNSRTGLIHRAYGGSAYIGVPANENDAVELARGFLREYQELARVPVEDLAPILSRHRGHHWFVHFRQQYRGFEVFGSHIAVRISDRGNVVLFECDYFPGIDLVTAPTISEDAARVVASFGLFGLGDSGPTKLVVFPLPGDDGFEYRLAYVLDISTDDPARYRTIVDANTGEVLYRKNQVRYITVDGYVNGMIYPATPFDSLVTRPFEYETINISGISPALTNPDGFFSADVPDNNSRTLTAGLNGSFVRVLNAQGAEASFTTSIVPGDTLQMLWEVANSRHDERTCFYHTNVIHDFINMIDPTFTDLDFDLPCNVNILDYCNAYWDGSSINFFTRGSGCSNTGEIADVIYHEYGHGITDFQYQPQSPSGMQHEGWSDYIAATITNQPIIGRGFYLNDPNGGIRTVDNHMFWPDSATGESHNDGLIVAGALWDLREALAPRVRYCDTLFHFARYGLSSNYPDYLVDILEYDDDDDNLFNGTPNMVAISTAFNAHGIVLPPLSISHQPLEDTFEQNPYPVTITLSLSLPSANDDSVFVMYRTRAEDPFTSLLLTQTSTPGEFAGAIPGQILGTLVEYYISVFDLIGTEFKSPATAPLPTYFFVVGQLQVQYADSLEHDSGWIIGDPSDDATSGVWERCDPNGTYADADPNYPYQPEDDHTVDPAVYCFVTGQHPLGEPNNGVNDVDGGRTTLTTTPYDLSAYSRPVVEYYRWFTTKLNVDDTMYVMISSDGSNWIPLEILTHTENFWKRSRFLVAPLLPSLNQVQIRFIATDEGSASMVESAVDDLTLYSVPVTGLEETPGLPGAFALRQNYPNPFNGQTEIAFELPQASDISLTVYDISGRIVSTQHYANMAAGYQTITLDSKNFNGAELPSGIYLYKLQAGQKTATKKMVLLK